MTFILQLLKKATLLHCLISLLPRRHRYDGFGLLNLKRELKIYVLGIGQQIVIQFEHLNSLLRISCWSQYLIRSDTRTTEKKSQS